VEEKKAEEPDQKLTDKKDQNLKRRRRMRKRQRTLHKQ